MSALEETLGLSPEMISEVDRAWERWAQEKLQVSDPEAVQVLRDIVYSHQDADGSILPPNTKWMEFEGKRVVAPDMDTLKRQAVEALEGITVRPMNAVQLQHWKDRNEMVCPHGLADGEITGQTDLGYNIVHFISHMELMPVFRPMMGVSETKGEALVGGEFDWNNQIEPTYFTCAHNDFWWPPEGLTFDWVG